MDFAALNAQAAVIAAHHGPSFTWGDVTFYATVEADARPSDDLLEIDQERVVLTAARSAFTTLPTEGTFFSCGSVKYRVTREPVAHDGHSTVQLYCVRS